MNKQITIMDRTMGVVRSFDKAICTCVTGTRANHTVHPFGQSDVKFGDVLHDFHVLESGSVAFKLDPKDESYCLSGFGIMFSPHTEANEARVNFVNVQQGKINKLLDKRNVVIEEFEHCDEKPIFYP